MMSRVTAPGREIRDRCPALISVIRACARWDINSCSAITAVSLAATRCCCFSVTAPSQALALINDMTYSPAGQVTPYTGGTGGLPMGLRSALEGAFASVGALGSPPVFGPGPEGTCGAAAGSTTAGIRPVSQDTVSYTRGSPNRSRAY